MRRFGVLYQQGALWSSMTLNENVALPLSEYTDLRAAGNPRDRLAQARARGPRRLRGLLSRGDQRRHAQAGGPRARHGDGPGNPVLRRAIGRPRPDQLAPARRSDPRSARQPGRDHRHGHPRAGQHPRDRRQFGVPRPRDQKPARDRRPARSARPAAGSESGRIPDPRRQRAPGRSPERMQKAGAGREADSR